MFLHLSVILLTGGVCVAEGGHAWQRPVHGGGGHVWQGVCMSGGMRGWGVCGRGHV